MIYDYVITKPELNEETLIHYGIPGMKWANHIYKTLRSKWAGKKLVKKHKKNRKSAQKIWNDYENKKEKRMKLIRKQRKEWDETGRNKSYNQRRDQISAAKKNAHNEWLHDTKKQRDVSEQVRKGRKKAHNKYVYKRINANSKK